MSERPFMQLYVSDFVGDTLDLSTEGIGAYMLLLMAMWNAGGSLPDDDTKLARITRLTVKKWRAIAADLLTFFERDNGRITHQRLSKELQKSESKSNSRASAGSIGGKAKALKDKNAPLANATPMPQHLPEARSQITTEPVAQQPIAAAPKDLLDQLLEANGAGTGFREERNIGLMNLAPILGLIKGGFELERDILAAIRSKPNAGARTWGYFVPQIRDYVAVRDKVAETAKPVAPAEDWFGRIAVWRESRTWSPQWGPKPGEAGCKVPPELLRDAA